jgi:hypothetical protein
LSVLKKLKKIQILISRISGGNTEELTRKNGSFSGKLIKIVKLEKEEITESFFSLDI